MTAPARWLIPELDARDVRLLMGELRIQAPAARVLVARGYRDPERAQNFLKPSLDSLHDPFRMKGMREAVARLSTAIQRREQILLYGDYDVDGTSSVVILKKAIEMAGGQAEFHVPHRLREGYGMRSDVIEDAARRGVALIISVDTGIRAVEAVARAPRTVDRRHRHRSSPARRGLRCPMRWPCSIPTSPAARIRRRTSAARASR